MFSFVFFKISRLKLFLKVIFKNDIIVKLKRFVMIFLK